MLEDLRFAIRTLRKAPGFTLLVLFTLAVAIGANTALFSVVKGVLLNPLPFDDPEPLVGVWHKAPGLGFNELNASPSTYFTYREENRVFEDTGLWRDGAATVTGTGEPERVDTLVVTDGTLPLLRVRAALGRIFTPADDAHKAPETVILTHSYWQRKFGGDRAVLGRTLKVDGKNREIIGVLPPGFRFLNEHPALILPMRFNRAEVFVADFSYMQVARLKPGATLIQANADVERMLPLMQEKFPLPPGLSKEMLASAGLAANVRPFKVDAVGDVGNLLWILLGTAGVVLLIACANVANLLLVRGEGRHQELAIRIALGANALRIARQLLLESLTLSLAGGLLGLPLAYAGIRILTALRPSHIPRLDEISVDLPVLLYALAVSVCTGLLFGLIPVLKFAAPRLALNLRDGGRGSSAGRERHRSRSALVVTQVALALVLLISSGLMLRSFQSLRQVRPGFQNPEQLLTLRISIPHVEIPKAADIVRTQQQLLQRIGAIPGVQSVAFASSATMDGSTNNNPIFVEGFPEQAGKLPPMRRFKFVSPGYFATIGNPILFGRDTTWDDVHNQRNVLLVSESFARKYWNNPALAVGKRIRETPTSSWREIIGVAGDERDDGAHKAAPVIVFWPALVSDFWGEGANVLNSALFLIRSHRTGTTSLLKDIQSAVWSINPGLPTANVRTLAEIQSRSMMRTTFTMLMLLAAGAIALLLGVVGIYGVISYAISQRIREIGIRMALGAQRADVSRLFVLHGLRLTIVGLALGIAAAVGVTRLLASLLFGVSPMDPVTYAAVSAFLAAAALLACYLPARRASALDPVRALHSD